MMRWRTRTAHGESVHGIDRLLGEIHTGPFERTLSGLTAAPAARLGNHLASGDYICWQRR